MASSRKSYLKTPGLPRTGVIDGRFSRQGKQGPFRAENFLDEQLFAIYLSYFADPPVGDST
ncbi:hypothetical protein OUZ56_011287 [Daphnia magna]|uniref:Uncharacterized protein n=1 Tax=Daphnia magna TaxID=35525 RepID=A0ABQ9YZQ5_9CRUS|nr:hypothetical protein OUZ56_011287 [Daphnia magna]